MNFMAIHIMKYQMKSWIRTTYSWASECHIDKCFSEFCYRINRSQVKVNIFNKLIQRMIESDKVFKHEPIRA